VYINNTDVQNEILNLRARLQTTESSVNLGGIGSNIYLDSNQLYINGYTGDFEELTSKKFNIRYI
jgi:hypothetical protein